MTDRPGQRAWRVFRVSCCAPGVDGLRRSGTRGIEGPSLGGVELLDPLQEIGWEHQGLDAPDGAGEDEFELRPRLLDRCAQGAKTPVHVCFGTPDNSKDFGQCVARLPSRAVICDGETEGERARGEDKVPDSLILLQFSEELQA